MDLALFLPPRLSRLAGFLHFLLLAFRTVVENLFFALLLLLHLADRFLLVLYDLLLGNTRAWFFEGLIVLRL
jgi:hypothetical protein